MEATKTYTHRIIPTRSKSDPRIIHRTERTADGHTFCTCKGYEFRRTCKHVKSAEHWK